MALEADLAVQQSLEVRQQVQAEEIVEDADNGSPVAHHPIAPPGEVFDMSTTVDPSYIICLIRKLLPPGEQYIDAHQTPNSLDETQSINEHLREGNNSPSQNGLTALPDDNVDTMDTSMDELKQSLRSGANENGSRLEPSKQSAREKVWEECGCILWDLAANKSHAELMVENLLLEVLRANFMISSSARITEIGLGIIGNIACHDVLVKKLISTDGLMEIIIDQVFSDDALCLCEVFRVLTLGLQGSECAVWASALQSENILRRIVWVSENSLNPLLIEKIMGLLLTILEIQQQAEPILLVLSKLGLPTVLVNLLAFEMQQLKTERTAERYPALYSILQAIEAISVTDDHSQEFCSNKELFKMACELVKFPDKTEMSSSCVAASVLIANILSDSPDLTQAMSKDLLFLQCLFDLFPFTSDDVEARSALWTIVARLLVRVQETEMNTSTLSSYVMVFIDKLELIEDDLLDNPLDTFESHAPVSYNCRANVLKRIISIAKQWDVVKYSAIDDTSYRDDCPDDIVLKRLLDCCYRHIH